MRSRLLFWSEGGTNVPTAARPRSRRQREDRVLLVNVAWDTYETLLGDVERQRVRLTYDRGDLEIMSPSPIHERSKEWLGMMVKILAEEFEIDFLSGGSTTLRRKALKKGLEPDQCFWFANAPSIVARKQLKLPKDPPPDLVIEVDYSSSSLDRMSIYAALKVPEVWRYDLERLTVYRLEQKNYAPRTTSPTFPVFPLKRIEEMLERTFEWSELQMIQAFRSVVRDAVSAERSKMPDER
jgi:Uma2 family endonuclease